MLALPQSKIVVFHGFMGVGADFEPFVDACGLEIDIEAPDLIGHGSFQCDDPVEYSLDAQLQYWSVRIPKGSVLIGYSMGGRLALQFACRYPDHLSGLVLIGATPGIEDPDERARRQKWDAAQADRICELGIEGFYNEWQRLPIIATQERIDPDIRSKMTANRLNQTIEGLSNSMLQFGTGTMPDCWDALPTLSLPILLMVGEEDAKYRGIASWMMGRFPGDSAESAIISNAGHCAHLESMSESSHVLKQWLKRHFS